MTVKFVPFLLNKSQYSHYNKTFCYHLRKITTKSRRVKVMHHIVCQLPKRLKCVNVFSNIICCHESVGRLVAAVCIRCVFCESGEIFGQHRTQQENLAHCTTYMSSHNITYFHDHIILFTLWLYFLFFCLYDTILCCFSCVSFEFSVLNFDVCGVQRTAVKCKKDRQGGISLYTQHTHIN